MSSMPTSPTRISAAIANGRVSGASSKSIGAPSVRPLDAGGPLGDRALAVQAIEVVQLGIGGRRAAGHAGHARDRRGGARHREIGGRAPAGHAAVAVVLLLAALEVGEPGLGV